MIQREISDHILTIGPSPDMKGGIAQVLDSYFSEVFDHPLFIAETVNGNKMRKLWASASAVFKIGYRLCGRKVKVVHLHSASYGSFPRSSFYAAFARMLGAKVVMHIHGASFRDYASTRPSVAKKLRKCDAVVALSESWKEYFNTELGVGNVFVIPNIVTRPSSPSKPSKPAEATFLGYIGERKGIFDLLEAIYRSYHKLKGKFILNVGGNGETDRFLERVERLGIGNIVKYHGWVGPELKAELLCRSSFYILPSYAEGLPISVLEAMSYALPVVSTPVGGIPEIVDSSNGLLVKPGDIDALGSAIVSLTENPEMAAILGEASLSKLSQHFPENVSIQLENMYRSLLKTDQKA